MKQIICSSLWMLAIIGSISAQTTFSQVMGTPFVDVREGSINFADVDGDQDQDVLITGRDVSSDGITELYLNDGTGNFSLVSGTSLPGVSLSDVAFADVDGDQDQDLVITGKRTGSPLVLIADLYLNDGLGNFSKVEGTPFAKVMSSAIAFADVDGDQDQDLLITGDIVGAYKISRLYLNDGVGNFTEAMGTPFDGVDNGSLAFADVDGDQDQDVLITGSGATIGRSAKLYLNDGVGNFSSATGPVFDPVANSSIAFSDVDGDQDQDVIIAGTGTNMSRITKLYTNDGLGNFTEVAGTPFAGVDDGEIAFADIDLDQDEDLMITGNGSSEGRLVRLYLNDGAGTFSELSGTPFIGVDNSALALADVDGDTDLDVLISGENTGSSYLTTLYLNELILDAISKPPAYEVQVFPNPTSGAIHIQFEQVIPKVSIEVLSLTGQVRYMQSFFANPSITIDLEAPSGIYWLKIQDQENAMKVVPILKR